MKANNTIICLECWYTSAKSFVTQYNRNIISRPYFGATGIKEPMITICTGIFDSKGKFIGTSSVDWVLDKMIKILANIKITKNTFVLFANKKHDFILVLNYDNADVDKNIGKSLSTIEWYSENLKNETRFFYNKKEYVCFIKHFSKNSALFLYTDGITEAQNTKKEFFGEQRLMDTINGYSSTAKNNIDNLKNTIKSFCDGAQQYDDMTMLNIIYKSEGTDRLIVDAKVDNWSTVYNFLIKNMIDKKIKKEYQSKVLLASEEIFINIANYAYEKEKDGKVWITTEKTDTTYDIVFVDSGKHYNPLEKKEPDVDASLEDRQAGGLGIYLVKKIMDKVEYKYENLKNIFTISVNLQK